MGLWSRLFGSDRPVEPAISHHANVGVTDGLLGGGDEKPFGTFDGNPSVVDELNAETHGSLGPLGGVHGAGADLAVDADVASDMESDVDHLEGSEENVWEALGAEPADVDGVMNHPRPGESHLDADADTEERDEDRFADETRDGDS